MILIWGGAPPTPLTHGRLRSSSRGSRRATTSARSFLSCRRSASGLGCVGIWLGNGSSVAKWGSFFGDRNRERDAAGRGRSACNNFTQAVRYDTGALFRTRRNSTSACQTVVCVSKVGVQVSFSSWSFLPVSFVDCREPEPSRMQHLARSMLMALSWLGARWQ